MNMDGPLPGVFVMEFLHLMKDRSMSNIDCYYKSINVYQNERMVNDVWFMDDIIMEINAHTILCMT